MYVTLGGYILSALLIAGLWWTNSQWQLEKANALLTQTELQSCGARLVNILEDIQSDNEIDNLPASALTTVPDHWLRPETSGGAD